MLLLLIEKLKISHSANTTRATYKKTFWGGSISYEPCSEQVKSRCPNLVHNALLHCSKSLSHSCQTQVRNLVRSETYAAAIMNHRPFNEPRQCSGFRSTFWSSPSSSPTDRVSVTLALQCSRDRFWMISEHCKRWQGRIIVAVGVSNKIQVLPEHTECVDRPHRGHSIHTSEEAMNSDQVLHSSDDYHQHEAVGHNIYVANGRRVLILPFVVSSEEPFPVNALRNHAM